MGLIWFEQAIVIIIPKRSPYFVKRHTGYMLISSINLPATDSTGIFSLIEIAIITLVFTS